MDYEEGLTEIVDGLGGTDAAGSLMREWALNATAGKKGVPAAPLSVADYGEKA